MWGYYVLLYLIFAVLFTQSYKIVLKTSNGKGEITVLLELLSGIVSLLLIPFYNIKFSSDYLIYCF